MKRLWRRLPAPALFGAMALGGCVADTAGNPVGGRGLRADAVARHDLGSPRAATIALASVEGAPGPVTARFEQAMATEAASREITVTDGARARYLVRGYLDAYATEGGTAVHYLWDVYDADKRHAQRLDDRVTVPGTAADPWSAVDDRVLTSLAARGADDLAAFLAGTPEASGSAAAGVPAEAGPPAAVAASPTRVN